MILELLQEINESRTEKGRGSKAGREKFSSKKGTKGSSVKSRKSRVKIYPTIKAALDSAAPYGHIFSTAAADRLYVITRPDWGKKSTAGGNARVAKGFTPGAATPSASWPSIKGHAVRTAIKHGKISSSRLKKKYGAGTERSEERRYAGKTSKRKAKGKTNEAQETSVMKIKEKHGIKDWNEFKEKLKVLESMPSTEKAKTGTRVFKGQDVGRGGGQGSQGTSNLPGSGVRRRKDPAAALKKASLQKAHTEYEGPSLREKLARLKEESPEGYRERMKKDTAKAVAQGRGRREMGTHRTPALKPKQVGVDRPRSVKSDHTEYEGPSLAETKDWIQGAEADIKRRGTEGKCTPITKPGCTGKAKALDKTFKKMAKKRDKDIVSKKEKNEAKESPQAWVDNPSTAIGSQSLKILKKEDDETKRLKAKVAASLDKYKGRK